MRYLDTLTRQGIRACILPGNHIRLDPEYLVDGKIATFVRSHKEEIIAEILANAAPHDTDAPEVIPAYRILWASPNLEWFEADDPRLGYETFLHPLQGYQQGVYYRMVDAEYFAWLERMMAAAKRSYDAKKLGKEKYHDIRWAFNPIEERALEILDSEELDRARKTLSRNRYQPPSESTFAVFFKEQERAWEEHEKRRNSPPPPISG